MARIIDGAEMNLIGSNLKRLRQERGWSQQLLSNKLETVAVYICRGSISRIEDKQRAPPWFRCKELSLILSFTGWPMFWALPLQTYLNKKCSAAFLFRLRCNSCILELLQNTP